MARRATREAHASRSHVIIEQVDEIVLGGVKLQVRGQDLPLESVLLDPTNPRIANTVASNRLVGDDKRQQKLRDHLWADPDVHVLYRSVLDNKGLIERIIVRSNHVVAEGNCRTVV